MTQIWKALSVGAVMTLTGGVAQAARLVDQISRTGTYPQIRRALYGGLDAYITPIFAQYSRALP